jgi:DNA/RNA-binding domain of Phe-tRNA-synthetase-like protein
MILFQYTQPILETFPNLIGGVIAGHDLHSESSPPSLTAAYQAEQEAAIARIGETPLSEIPSLAGWRTAFRQFGVDPTQYRSAAEALLRRLTKKGDIPSINLLVDIGNLVSIRYGLPVAILDLNQLNPPITVQFATGDEHFSDLGGSESDTPNAGEVIFADPDGAVCARRWCWRQSAGSAAQPTTTDILVTVEAQHANGRVDVEAAIHDLLSLLKQFAGGRYESALLDTANPAFSEM